MCLTLTKVKKTLAQPAALHSLLSKPSLNPKRIHSWLMKRKLSAQERSNTELKKVNTALGFMFYFSTYGYHGNIEKITP